MTRITRPQLPRLELPRPELPRPGPQIIRQANNDDRNLDEGIDVENIQNVPLRNIPLADIDQFEIDDLVPPPDMNDLDGKFQITTAVCRWWGSFYTVNLLTVMF